MADLGIDQKATEPQRVSVDGQDVAQRPLKDLIAAEKYANQAEAAARTGLPFRMVLFRPPGTVGGT